MTNEEALPETSAAAKQKEHVEDNSALQKEPAKEAEQTEDTLQPEENKDKSDSEAKAEPLPAVTSAVAEQSNKPSEDGGGGGWGWGGWGTSLWSSVSTVTESAQALGPKVCY